MKIFLILLFAAMILFSGCVGQRTVKLGDNVSVDYTGSLPDGKVFDTSIESVGKENNIIKPEYKPLNFTVGKNMLIKGFEEGVIGMKVGDSKTFPIPPERGYGPSNPKLIQVIPIITDVPATTTFPKVFQMPGDQFMGTFGPEPRIGDNVTIHGTNINLTIRNITSDVELLYNLPVGYRISSAGATWNQTVIKVDEKNITIKPDVKKNDIVQLPSAPWKSTVIDVNDRNITLKHNAIPDTEIPDRFGRIIRVHFNETAITLDSNPELAGKTLVFNVTLRSIDK